MTYLGVNFVLTAGLHSYGFGGGGVVRWMVAVALLEAAFLVVGGWYTGATIRRRPGLSRGWPTPSGSLRASFSAGGWRALSRRG